MEEFNCAMGGWLLRYLHLERKERTFVSKTFIIIPGRCSFHCHLIGGVVVYSILLCCTENGEETLFLFSLYLRLWKWSSGGRKVLYESIETVITSSVSVIIHDWMIYLSGTPTWTNGQVKWFMRVGHKIVHQINRTRLFRVFRGRKIDN